MNNTLVLKFGGTSVQSAAAMKNVIDIVCNVSNGGKMVVASACAGVTNGLIELAGSAATADSAIVEGLIADLAERHRTICRELLGGTEWFDTATEQVENLCAELRTLCEGIALLRECTERSHATLLSFGERLSTAILTAGFLAAGVQAVLIDARQVMRTDSDYLQARAQMSEVETLSEMFVRPYLDSGTIVVTQGFVGADNRGRTTVLGRGGSDLSAAIFGAALNVGEIQIWTDVSGIYTTDPRIVPHARAVPAMSFAEAGELAYFGAKVLHPDTIRPAVEKGIPVRVLNTFHPGESGTLLVPHIDNAGGGIRAVAVKKGCVLVSLGMKAGQSKAGFMAAVYTAMERHGVEALCAEGAECHYSFCGASPATAEALCRDLQVFARCHTQHIALLCACAPRSATVGQALALAEVAGALAPLQPLFITQSSGGAALLSAVPEEHAETALRALHDLIPLGQEYRVQSAV